jgi:uncharacterized membrane protein
MHTPGIIPLILPVHILAGVLALVFGYVALYATKGATLHRKVGILFVYVMVTMAITGMLISAVEGVAPAINIPSALLTFYLVITSLTTVRSPADGSRRLDIAAMLMAFGISVSCFALSLAAIARGGPGAGIAYPLFLFGGVGLSAGVGDLRMVRARGIRGASRLVRHLWRMCFALFIASVAFFPRLGRLELFPKPLLALPVLLPIFLYLYWRWRLRPRLSSRPSVGVSARAAA